MKILSKTIIFALAMQSFPSFAISYLQLAKHSYWLQLGHYGSATLNEWKSEVDDERFFLSKSGKTKPFSELIATIDAFNGKYLTEKETNEIRCAFPARYTWLKSKIDNNWPKLNCVRFNRWKNTVNPEGMTLVFPTAFMNSPSSMFGHTLLRIDAKNQNKSRELVAFAINFAAQPDSTDNAAVYAFKGLVGMYPGNFSVMPYYRKVREYNDIESRDIWEYKLNLSKQEVHRILLHLWELQRATFDYYFVDENCSYQLLSLLQLANEELDLTSSFSYQAIPSDTVVALRNKKLLQEPNYRPAVGTRLYHYAKQLSTQEFKAVRNIVENDDFEHSQYDKNRQAAILEMAYEWLTFDFNDQGLNRDSIAPRLNKLLTQRSKIKTSVPFTEPPTPVASPEKGHNSSRLGLGLSNSNNYDNRTHISYRLAYHDLLDHSVGYIPGAQISFFDLETSFDNGRSRIEHLYLINAMSLAPDNKIFDSWSWSMKLGFDRQPSINKQNGRMFSQAGYGKSFGDPNMVHTYILGSMEFNGGDITNKIDVGLGIEFGAVWQVNSNNKVAITGNIMGLVDSEVTHHKEFTFAWNWGFNTNWALRGNINHKLWLTEDTQAKLTVYHYF